ncbi:MAG: BamA/TamA family outer membrane protein [Candidatus Krumholzibacteriia bacterium]
MHLNSPPVVAGALLTVAMAVSAPCGSIEAAAAGEGPVAGPSLASVEDGWGESVWGWIPPPTPELTHRFEGVDRALWEHVLLVPYDVLAFLPRAVATALGGTAQLAADSRVPSFVYDTVTLKGTPLTGEVSASLGGTDGLGVGYAVTAPIDHRAGNGLRLAGALSTKRHVRANLGVWLGRPARALELGVGYSLEPNTRFFGLGPDAPERQLSYYTEETTWLGVGLRSTVARGWVVGGMALMSSVAARGPRAEQSPPLEAVFLPGERPAGYGERSEGVSLELEIVNDGVADDRRPDRGGRQRLLVSRFQGASGADADFWSLRLDLQRFLALPAPARTLALRGMVAWLVAEGDRPIPFQRLMTSAHPDLLRGYPTDRWRDRGLLVANAEYRWPIWTWNRTDGLGVDAVAFSDLGQVFAEPDGIRLDRLTVSWGGGLRLITATGLAARAELGWSTEGAEARLAASQLFGYEEGGLFRGRDPVPGR